jgi:hypothetical protein
MDLPRDIVFAGRFAPAVQTHPEAQHRVREAIPLLGHLHEIDVFEPRQVVLGRTRRPAQALGDRREGQHLLFGQHVEDGLERAVAARAMQAQLVREVARGRETAAG